ncbi:PCMD domain-containing protein [Chitinophaga oryzae]|uniref:PCMD domain-containing protein n=1 Tax=Chitinophaga oryzae TaxID=2725414 RepID=A0AAE6ZEX3_9BACT|nr:PCMD domain-containing protein [Chitinophaga oryzae]QJB31416.1 PCMD domain-containing protein [Chitinophaga oryzae]QJB37900.1 PCMD domain-containing protein [Chitinophaga oryzae]
MRLRNLCYLTVLVGLQACIKDAPMNPEADIETFSIDKKLLSSDVFIDQANAKVMLYLTHEAYETGIAPTLTLSAGATVTPASGDSIHFEPGVHPQYVVTSANGLNKKTYKVEVITIGTWQWDFEKWMTNNKDKYQYPINDDSTVVWSSGNPGIALSGVPKDPMEYPLRVTTDAYHGQHAAEMVTRKGTALSNLVGIKLFAGSLFVGVFDAQFAFLEPLKATQFGQPYIGKPLRFTGYYKYKPGANYQDKAGNIVPGMTDSCAVYAVLYSGTTRLDATNISNSERIIATAYLPDGSTRENWTRFDIPFVLKRQIDSKEKMMMAIVASSSKNGDSYKGAIGSRLVLDSLEIVHQ